MPIAFTYRKVLNGTKISASIPLDCGNMKSFLANGFTEDDVLYHAVANIIVKAQGPIRKHAKDPKAAKPPSSRQEWVKFLKPTVRLTSEQKQLQVANEMTKEELAAHIVRLQKVMEVKSTVNDRVKAVLKKKAK